MEKQENNVQQVIRETYGRNAELANQTIEGAKQVAQAFGYSKEELESIPQESNMGLSCGNPTAMASIKEGEVILDLGSGGGLDCFLAAQKVGDSGKVIGVDMTPRMIDLARNNATKAGKNNVEFRLGEIEALPVADASVDCVISNCVINLSVNKPKVFQEIFRVLKPGGRLAVSDLCLKKELPIELKDSITAYVGCISGALSTDHYRELMEKAGFSAIDIIDTKSDLNAYTLLGSESTSCCASLAMPTPAERSPCCASSSTSKPVESSPCCTLSSTSKPVESSPCCASSSTSKPVESSPCCTPSFASKLVENSPCCVSGQSQPTKQQSTGGSDNVALSKEMLDLLRKYDVNEYIGSYKLFACKSA